MSFLILEPRALSAPHCRAACSAVTTPGSRLSTEVHPGAQESPGAGGTSNPPWWRDGISSPHQVHGSYSKLVSA